MTAIYGTDEAGPFETLRGTKIGERLAIHIAQRIIDDNLAEGTPLPTEKEMSQQYGLGRTTIREALRLLEARGIVSIRPGRGGGPMVRTPMPADLGEALRFQFLFDGVLLSEVIEARHALEHLTARLAAERISDEDVERLQQTIDLMRTYSGDSERFARENAQFHSIIAHASGSQILATLVAALDTIADGRVLGIRYNAKAQLGTAQAHQLVVDALGAHDPDRTELAMKTHLDEAERFWRRSNPHGFTARLRWDAAF